MPVVEPVAAEQAPAAATAAESAPVDPKAAPAQSEPKPDPMSPRFAALARQTREIAAAKQALAKERAALEAAQKARDAEVQGRLSKAEEIERGRELALKDPVAYLKSLYGEDWYDLATKLKLEGDKGVPPDLQVRALREDYDKRLTEQQKATEERFKKLEEEREAARREQEERLKADVTTSIADAQAESVDFVKANAEKYELITLTGSEGDVFEVIRQAFARTGKLLSNAEAADLVETHLEEQAAKVFGGKKWQTRQSAAQQPAKVEQDAPARTLTNQNGTGTSIPSGGKEDRMQRAVAAMEEAERRAAARAAK